MADVPFGGECPSEAPSADEGIILVQRRAVAQTMMARSSSDDSLIEAPTSNGGGRRGSAGLADAAFRSEALRGSPAVATEQEQPELLGNVHAVAPTFSTKSFPAFRPEEVMNFARPGSGIPEGLWGIWWMDQGGFSSIAHDGEYPFNMIDTPEELASFGPEPGASASGLQYDEKTGCVSPVALWGGPHWAALGNTEGQNILRHHWELQTTLYFCFVDAQMETIQIRQKMLLPQMKHAPFHIGKYVASWFGFEDAGEGKVWLPHGIINMTMVKKPWGWDRVTTLLDRLTDLSPFKERLLKMMLPSGMFEQLQIAKQRHQSGYSHYPVLQIIDGHGAKTKYFDEFRAFMKSNDLDRLYHTEA